MDHVRGTASHRRPSDVHGRRGAPVAIGGNRDQRRERDRPRPGVQGRSLNMRAALVHMVTDAIGLAGTIVAAIAVLLWAALDRSRRIAGDRAAVIYSGFRLPSDTTHVLLEGTPSETGPRRRRGRVARRTGIEAVHHLHLWSLVSDVPALSAHVVLAGEVSLHEAQQRGDELKQVLATSTESCIRPSNSNVTRATTTPTDALRGRKSALTGTLRTTSPRRPTWATGRC